MSHRQQVARKRGPPSAPDRTGDRTALDYFGAHPIFRLDDFITAYATAGRTPAAAKAAVHHHTRSGRLLNIQRGVYRYTAVSFDGFALGCQLTADGVIAYGSAVAFHRLLELRPPKELTVMTAGRIRGVEHEGCSYRSVAPSAPGVGVEWYPGRHQPVRVTSPARTIADIVHRPDLGPGLTQAFQVLCNAQVSTRDVFAAAVALGSAQTICRLGYLMHFHPVFTAAGAVLLEMEREFRPRQPFYWDEKTRTGKGGVLFHRWNVIVPTELDAALSRFLAEWHSA